jgi:hypothetical protein
MPIESSSHRADGGKRIKREHKRRKERGTFSLCPGQPEPALPSEFYLWIQKNEDYNMVAVSYVPDKSVFLAVKEVYLKGRSTLYPS